MLYNLVGYLCMISVPLMLYKIQTIMEGSDSSQVQSSLVFEGHECNQLQNPKSCMGVMTERQKRWALKCPHLWWKRQMLSPCINSVSKEREWRFLFSVSFSTCTCIYRVISYPSFCYLSSPESWTIALKDVNNRSFNLTHTFLVPFILMLILSYFTGAFLSALRSNFSDIRRLLL